VNIPVGKIGSFRDDTNEKVCCPRCQVNLLPVGYIGARSRADNKTEVCSECGQQEALNQFMQNGYTEPVDEWPVITKWRTT
jgi:hypothetical protein